MAVLKYSKSANASNFEYSDVSTYVPGWGTWWGSTFGRDWDLFGGIESDYVKVKPKSITYYPYNFLERSSTKDALLFHLNRIIMTYVKMLLVM